MMNDDETVVQPAVSTDEPATEPETEPTEAPESAPEVETTPDAEEMPA